MKILKKNLKKKTPIHFTNNFVEKRCNSGEGGSEKGKERDREKKDRRKKEE